MARSQKPPIGRRGFIKGAAGSAAILAAGAPPAAAQAPTASAARTPEPTAATREAESGAPSSVEVLTNERPGSDFMVDVLRYHEEIGRAHV